MAQKKYLDQEGVQYLWSKVSLQDYPNNDTLVAVLNAIDDTKADKDYVETLYKKLNSNATLGFYCVEDVTVVVNDVSTIYPANSNVEIKMANDDIFEIIPTSDYSILSLSAFPGALGIYYPWLEGVKQFSNILFDMNAEDMYTKWNQGNQGAYQVQYAQYSNCIFWSDNPYISDVAKRTNYTLYNSAQLPLCYSNIPDNTFKAFYLALGVVNDPNWSNSTYKESFAKATYATQVFSYYGARIVGTPEHFTITLPTDCRGLMFYARNVEAAGTFDAANVTNFGAKSGSWRDAFGYCDSLRKLYIENLKVNLNVSWSPINQESISYIISNAANTNAITISVSPYTYYLLQDSDFQLAASKNITIELITTNYVEDRRLSNIANKADMTYVNEKIDSVPQSNWEISDSSDKAYIQNRPFYNDETRELLVDWDGTPTDEYFDGGAKLGTHYLISTTVPTAEELLGATVVWNNGSNSGTYTITEDLISVRNDLDYAYGGAISINYWAAGGDPGSFGVIFDNSNFFEGYSLGIYTKYPLSITLVSTSLKQLDEIFIPDTIARTEDIPSTTGLASEEYVDIQIANQSSETWTFTLADGSIVTKTVVVK